MAKIVFEFANHNEAISSASTMSGLFIVTSRWALYAGRCPFGWPSSPLGKILHQWSPRHSADTFTHRRRQPHPLWLVADLTLSRNFYLDTSFYRQALHRVRKPLGFPEAASFTSLTHPASQLGYCSLLATSNLGPVACHGKTWQDYHGRVFILSCRGISYRVGYRAVRGLIEWLIGSLQKGRVLRSESDSVRLLGNTKACGDGSHPT